jgi:hypothetical protein
MDQTQPATSRTKTCCAFRRTALTPGSIFFNAETAIRRQLRISNVVAALDADWGHGSFQREQPVRIRTIQFCVKRGMHFYGCRSAFPKIILLSAIYYSEKNINAVWSRYATSTTGNTKFRKKYMV